MLRVLHIENIAVIENADIEFEPGMNVLTGETGAGKSIVIDAMGAVLGERTSKELVRSGTQSALVSAVFDADNCTDWCEDNGIEPEEGEVTILRRISSEGKSTCRVNGCPVSISQLKDLGMHLLDIHGQNDGQKLLDDKNHLKYLDSFARNEKQVEAYSSAYSKYRELLREKESLSMDEQEKARRMDSLQYQINELERAKIVPGEWDEKTERRDLLKNSVKLTDAVNTAFFAIYGGDRSGGAAELISEAEGALNSASRYSQHLGELGEKLADIRYSVEDIAEQLRDIKDDLDFSPEELDELDSRLEQLRRLMRKYGGSEQDMLDYLEQSKEELDKIEYSSERLEKLEKELQKAKQYAEKQADELSKVRKTAALALQKRIMDELSQLSMAGVKFEVHFEAAKHELTSTGMDDVSFLMSANQGEKPGKISKIASGGELSRIMLAMKNVLAENDSISSMVFDEVDTGVSGIAAQRVAEKMANLAAKKQVICVTHLPQIAAMADTHFEISKRQTSGRTFTDVRKLDISGREGEIARLVGGDNISDTTLTAAREQIEAAAKYKSRG